MANAYKASKTGRTNKKAMAALSIIGLTIMAVSAVSAAMPSIMGMAAGGGTINTTEKIYVAMGVDVKIQKQANGQVNVTGYDLSNGGNFAVGDKITKYKSMLTKNELPNELADGSIVDNKGVVYTYSQSIALYDNTTIKHDNHGGYFYEPLTYLDIGRSPVTSPLYTYSVSFGKFLNLSSPDVWGKRIKLLGNEYIIAPTSAYDGVYRKKLVLYEGLTSTMAGGETKRVYVPTSYSDYTVKLVGVTSASAAIVSVNGDTLTLNKGTSAIISGIIVYVENATYNSATDQTKNFATLIIGANKITLEDGTTAKNGTSDSTIPGTLVMLSGFGFGVNESGVPIGGRDYLISGSTHGDLVFGLDVGNSFRTAFYVANVTTTTCDDTDDGLDYYLPGAATYGLLTANDTCVSSNAVGSAVKVAESKYLREAYCNNNQVNTTIYTCPNGCKNGACIAPAATCNDTDGGRNYYVKGSTSGTKAMYSPITDQCDNSTYLEEFFCHPTDLGSVSVETVKCEAGCKNGACIAPTTSTNKWFNKTLLL